MDRRKAVLGILSLGGAAASCGRLSLDEPLAFPGDHAIVSPPALSAPARTTVGLLSAVGGPNALRVEWRVPEVIDPGLELALFVGPDSDALFLSTPIPLDIAAGRAVLDPAPLSGAVFVGLGARTDAATPFLPAGGVLAAHVGTTLFVDASAAPGGDGLSPATATSDLLLAGLLAFSFGGGTVQVAEGDYGELQLPLLDGVHLAGGFDASFDLSTRDPEQHPCVLRGLPELPIVDVSGVVTSPSLDGFVLDGQGLAASGVQASGAPLELRRTRIGGTRRGVLLLNAENADPVRIIFAGVRIEGCPLEGVSVSGPFRIELESSEFQGNGQEGFDCSNLVAPDGKTVSLSARGCRFTTNGAEGLDSDLIYPVVNIGQGGRFVFRFVDCVFEANAGTGLLVDIDFDLLPQWSLDIAIEGCRSRGNGLHGMRLDLDSTARALVHRTVCSANADAGLKITSESHPGTVIVSACAFLANVGPGVLSSEGNVGVLASHCAFLGNLGGGFLATLAPGTATSCAATQQANPYPPGGALASVSQPASLPAMFAAAPREVARVEGFDGTFVFLSAIPGGGPTAELADDGVPRAVVGQSANRLRLDPPPTGTWAPSTLAFFDPGVGVEEDWSPAPGSAATGAGLPPLAGPPPHAGPAGAPGGGAPGTSDPAAVEPFRLATVDPPWTLPIDPLAEIRLSFCGGGPDPAAAPLGVTLLDAGGAAVPLTPFVQGGALHIPAPAGGWRTGQSLVLLADLRSTDGRPLAAPVAIPIRTP